MTTMGNALTEALSTKALALMFPTFENMTEAELRPIYEEMERVRLFTTCPYSGGTFNATTKFMMVNELDGTITVGFEAYLKIRSFRDRAPYVQFSLVYEPLKKRYTELREAREEQERIVAAEAARRRDILNRITQAVEMLRHINKIDGYNLMPAAFDRMAQEIALASGITEDDFLIYLEMREDATKAPAA